MVDFNPTGLRIWNIRLFQENRFDAINNKRFVTTSKIQFNGLKNATSLFKTYITFSTPPNCYTVIRNPDEDEIGPWCYTIIDGLVEMEHCTIELCPGKYLMSSRISILVDIQQFQLLSCINWIIILFAILNEQHNYRSNSKGLANRKASSSFLSSQTASFNRFLMGTQNASSF